MKIYLILLVVLLSACAQVAEQVPSADSSLEPAPLINPPPLKTTKKKKPPKTAVPIAQAEETLLKKLNARHQEWRGTKYRYGSLNKKYGVDCSGFVLLTFRDLLGIELPRSTREQNLLGKEVKKDQLQAGDLVFFHTGRTKHVGIYMENSQFLHASTRAGVKISSLNETYWKRNYWKAKRLDLALAPTKTK